MKLTKAQEKAIDKLIIDRLNLNDQAMRKLWELKLQVLEAKFQEALKQIEEKYTNLGEELHKDVDIFFEAERASSKKLEDERKKQLEEIQRHNSQIETGLNTLVDLVKHLVGKK